MPIFKNRNRVRRIAVGFFTGTLILGLTYCYFFKRNTWCPKAYRYSEFGIRIPPGYLIHGIDVSHYQHAIDWNAVLAMKIRSVKMDFVFIKATEGRTYVDPYFQRNWRKTGKTRLARGAYHFFNPQVSGVAQAENYIKQVALKPGDLPPVLDVEQLENVEPEQLQKGVRDWLTRVQAHYKVKPIIYSGAHFYDKYLADEFSDYPVWVAHYTQSCQPRVRANWAFWQHNDRGRVNGIAPGVDFNVFNGSRTEFDSFRIAKTIL